MDRLVQLIVEKTGISEDAARQAITVVVEQIESRLPAGMAGHIDALLKGESTGVLGTISEKLGEFFRKAG